MTKKNFNLMSVFVVAICLVVTTMFSRCGKESVEIKDEYYVKYIVKSSTAYIGLSRTANISSENNFNSFTFNNSTWEMTIGPVKKGFYASLSASFNISQLLGPLERTYINVEIHISKNNAPFALKASDISTQVRASASTSYTIN